MSVRFLIDEQLPPELARWLSGRGYPSDHVGDLGLAGAEDGAIAEEALRTGAAVWSKDRDFAERARGPSGVRVVWLRFGNTTSAELNRRLAPLLSGVANRLRRGENPVVIP